MKQNNYIVSIICILIGIVIAFSFIYVNSIGDHICIGEQCYACVQLDLCKTLFRDILSSAVLLVMFIFIPISLSKIKTYSNLINKPTLVSLKVKLRN